MSRLKALEIMDANNNMHRLTVEHISCDNFRCGKTWLYKYSTDDSLGHDMVYGVMLSAPNFEQANQVFIDELVKKTPWYNISDYSGSKWEAVIEGEDYSPDRTDPILMTDFLHA